jgi:hypothetical protein
MKMISRRPTERPIYTTGIDEKLAFIAEKRSKVKGKRERGLSAADQLRASELEAYLDDLERRVRLGARMAGSGLDIMK